MSIFTPPTFDVPAGEPGALMAAATVFRWHANDVAAIAGELAGTVPAIVGWSGGAYDAALGETARAVETVQLVADAFGAGADITETLAQAIAAAQASSRDAQQRAFEIANWAIGLTNPVYGIFSDVIGIARSASDRADEAKRTAAQAYQALVESAPSYVPPPFPPPRPEGERGLFSRIAHGTLDVIGLVPVLGEPADVLNGFIYLAEGDNWNAGLSFASAVPVLGYGATAVKYGSRGADLVRGSRAGDAVVDAGRQVDEIGTPNVAPSTPLLGGSDRVPPIDTTPPLGQRGSRNTPQGQRQPDDPPEIPGPVGGRNPTTYDPTPRPDHRDPLAEALREQQRRLGAQASTDNTGRTGRNLGGRAIPNDEWDKGTRLADDLNQAAIARGDLPAISSVWSVRDFKTVRPETFVRISFEGSSRTGGYLARADDLVGLTPAQIIDRLALPVRLDNPGAALMVQRVDVPAKFKLRESVIRPHIDAVHKGQRFNGLGHIAHGNQYQLMEELAPTAFGVPRRIEGVLR